MSCCGAGKKSSSCTNSTPKTRPSKPHCTRASRKCFGTALSAASQRDTNIEGAGLTRFDFSPFWGTPLASKCLAEIMQSKRIFSALQKIHQIAAGNRSGEYRQRENTLGHPGAEAGEQPSPHNPRKQRKNPAKERPRRDPPTSALPLRRPRCSAVSSPRTCDPPAAGHPEASRQPRRLSWRRS
jgi:hypothetical protein